MGDWKLIFPHDTRSYVGVPPGKDGWPGPYNHYRTGLELYDLRRDPGERYNVIEQYPEITEKLQQYAEEARTDLGDDLTGIQGSNRRPVGRIE